MEIKILPKPGRHSGSTTAVTKILQGLLYNWDVKVLVATPVYLFHKDLKRMLGECASRVEFTVHNNLKDGLRGRNYDIVLITDFSLITGQQRMIDEIRLYGRTKYLLLEQEKPRDYNFNYEIYN